MYGGDEVSVIVVDLGSHTCKAGYTGEYAPKAVFPSDKEGGDKPELEAILQKVLQLHKNLQVLDIFG